MHPSTDIAWQCFSPSSLVSAVTEQVWAEKLLEHYQELQLLQPEVINYLTSGYCGREISHVRIR